MAANYSYTSALSSRSMELSSRTLPSGCRALTDTASSPTFFTVSSIDAPWSTKSMGPLTATSPLWGTTAIWTIHWM